jgi:hypothetical protein
MKTSTKIILLLAVLVFAASLSMFVVSKLHQKNSRAGYEWTTKVLQPFSVVVGMGNTDFTIEGCDSDAVACYVRKGHVTNMYVRNDTLYVQQTNVNNATFDKVVVRSRSLRSIVVSPCDTIGVYTLKAGPLSLMCKGGDLTIENWDEKVKKAHSVTTSLDIIAEDSAKIHLSNMHIEKWSIHLNHAVLQTNDIVSNDLKLNLKNHSWAELYTKPTSLIAVQDSTSHFFIK